MNKHENAEETIVNVPAHANSNVIGNPPELKAASPWAIAMTVAAMAAGILIGIFLMTNPTQAGAHGNDAKAPVAANQDVVKIDPERQEHIKVDAATVQSFRAEKLTSGRIAFNDDTSTLIFFPFTGRITKLFAEPGKKVAPGEPLLEIDSPDVVQPQADLINAMTALKNSQTALRLAQKNEAIAKREIESATRNLELNKINEVRQKELFDDKAVSRLAWETAEQSVKQAEQTLETAHKDYEQSQNDVDTAKANNEANETVLNAARDRLHGVFGKTDEEIAKLEKTHSIDRIMRVLAPIVGTITQRKCYVGEFITQSITDPLFVIANLSTVWMLADVYEIDINRIKRGQAVEVSVMAFPEEKFSAKISYISPSCDPATHRVAVRCVVDNPDEKMKSDMFASFRISTGEGIKATAVPQKAVIREGDKKIVWIKKGEGEFMRREVTTGMEQNGQVEILSGLQAGENVVCEGGVLVSGVVTAQ